MTPDPFQTLHVGSPAPAQAGWLDSASWALLAAAPDLAAAAGPWLAIQCQMVPGLDLGVVVYSDGRGEEGFVPVAVWPAGAAVGPALMAVAEMALKRARGVVRTHPGPDGAPRDALAYPLLIDGQARGVAAVEGGHRDEAELPALMRRLQWGTAWLEALVRRQGGEIQDRSAAALDLACAALRPARFAAAATAVATDLAGELDCERVSLSFLDGRRLRLRALSHSADFDRKSGLARGLIAAMEEALDQQDLVVFPAPAGQPPQIVQAHAELLERHGCAAACSVPLSDGERLVGVLTLERRSARPFDAAETALCTQVAALVGPLLEAKRRDDRWIGLKAVDSARTGVAALVGEGHLGVKLAALTVLALIAFLVLAQGEYRVRAPATLEGVVQRAIAAPVDGYVATAPARAGDIVAAGDTLFTIEDKDLRLERVRLAAERGKLEREYAQALAKDERATVRVLGARIAQTDARLALVEEQLARTRATAPFPGIVVAGDLSQSLGTPVTRGQVLFQVAPLDAYRVRLLVDEQDVPDLAVGQPGVLALTGMPARPLAIRVTKITPVARVEQGRNAFVVEAALEESVPALRPGMEGVAKVAVERRSLWWIWTHRMGYWVRLWAWSWLP